MAKWIEHEQGAIVQVGPSRLSDEQREALRLQIEQTHSGLSEQHMATSNLTAFSLDYPKVARELLPHLLALLRDRIPGEAKAMAEAAAATPGLDEVSLAALADWLEERGLFVEGANVRALGLNDGDLLVLQPMAYLHREAMEHLRRDAVAIRDDLLGRGLNVGVLVLPHGLNLQHVRPARKPPEQPLPPSE